MSETEAASPSWKDDVADVPRRVVNVALLRVAIVVFLLWAAALPTARASGPNRAGIVVTFGDGSSTTRCVEFDESEISGAELLQRSGLSLVTWGTGGGAAVCKIENEGCDDPNNCWCQCRGADCHYWAYYFLDGGQWKYAQMGASLRKVHDGDVDGWAWGSGKAGEGAAPQLLTFDDICAPLAPTVPPPSPTSPPPPTADATVAPPTPRAAVTDAPPSSSASPIPSSEPKTPDSTLQPAITITSTAATPAPTSTPTSDEGGNGGVPFQIVAFGGIAGVLVAAAGTLFWRRSHG